MAQTTGGISAVNAKVEVSTNGSSWTDISGSTNKVDPSGGNRMTGESYTFDGDGSIVTAGKRETLDLNIAVIYTETAGEGFEFVRAQFEAVGPLYLRYSPNGGGIGDYMYTSGVGVVTEFQYPSIESEEGGPIVCEFVLKVGILTQSVVS